eukprot:TRINITY_DN54463_c0_g1_i1.p2 TRINITY_DN54463_c0_g1~~TRINITY_DN54463_c0_g1_i1.p2  ORF type:complete len:305 (+),score=76.73 TRINITY_DN54463_c0_g1_i1:52-966(+)
MVFFFFKQKTAYEMLRSLVGSEMCIRDRYQRRVRERNRNMPLRGGCGQRASHCTLSLDEIAKIKSQTNLSALDLWELVQKSCFTADQLFGLYEMAVPIRTEFEEYLFMDMGPNPTDAPHVPEADVEREKKMLALCRSQEPELGVGWWRVAWQEMEQGARDMWLRLKAEVGRGETGLVPMRKDRVTRAAFDKTSAALGINLHQDDQGRYLMERIWNACNPTIPKELPPDSSITHAMAPESGVAPPKEWQDPLTHGTRSLPTETISFKSFATILAVMLDQTSLEEKLKCPSASPPSAFPSPHPHPP